MQMRSGGEQGGWIEGTPDEIKCVWVFQGSKYLGISEAISNIFPIPPKSDIRLRSC